MEEKDVYQNIIWFSEEIEKIRQKYRYRFSDLEIIGEPNKIKTRVHAFKDEYKKACDFVLNEINKLDSTLTAIQMVYYKSLIYNILRGNLSVLMCEMFNDTKSLVRLDIDQLCNELIYG